MEWMGPKLMTEGRWAWFTEADSGTRILVHLNNIDFVRPAGAGAELCFASGKTVVVRQDVEDVDRALHAEPMAENE
jgi:phosphotransferase system IIA component